MKYEKHKLFLFDSKYPSDESRVLNFIGNPSENYLPSCRFVCVVYRLERTIAINCTYNLSVPILWLKNDALYLTSKIACFFLKYSDRTILHLEIDGYKSENNFVLNCQNNYVERSSWILKFFAALVIMYVIIYRHRSENNFVQQSK